MDLYDSYMLLPDKHVGRAEVRLRNLRGMPETFTNYYEVWEKQLSTGASSRVGRVKTMASNVGAVQAMISYIYQESEESVGEKSAEKAAASTARAVMTNGYRAQQKKNGLDNEKAIRENLRSLKHNTAATSNTEATDDQLAAEFRQHIKQQREATAINFRKYEENNDENENIRETTKPLLDDGLDFPDESETEEGDLGLAHLRLNSDMHKKDKKHDIHGINSNDAKSKSTGTANKQQGSSSWFNLGRRSSHKRTSSTHSSSTSYSRLDAHEPDSPPSKKNEELANTVNVLADDEGSLKPFPLLSAIGSWTTNKETNQVLRAILKLLAAFVSRIYAYTLYMKWCE